MNESEALDFTAQVRCGKNGEKLLCHILGNVHGGIDEYIQRRVGL